MLLQVTLDALMLEAAEVAQAVAAVVELLPGLLLLL